jgi:hypothetical protein
MIRINCTQCGEDYEVEDALRGKVVQCRACNDPIKVPGRADPQPPPRTPPQSPVPFEVFSLTCPRCAAVVSRGSSKLTMLPAGNPSTMQGWLIRCQNCDHDFPAVKAHLEPWYFACLSYLGRAIIVLSILGVIVEGIVCNGLADRSSYSGGGIMLTWCVVSLFQLAAAIGISGFIFLGLDIARNQRAIREGIWNRRT